MSGNCAINFHRYHCNTILVVFRCFGAIEKLYLFLSLSGIFTGPLRVFLGNMGVFLGILWYSWVNVWTVENPYWTSVLSNTGFQYNTDSSPIRVFNTIQIRVQYGFSIQYRLIQYISILYIALYNNLLISSIVCLVTLKIGKTIPKKSTGYQIFFLIKFILRTDQYIL
jgi:hypothetical protein